MLLSAASATMKPFFVTTIGNVLLNMQSDSAVRMDNGRLTASAASLTWWRLRPRWRWRWRWRRPRHRRRRRLRDVTLPTLWSVPALWPSVFASAECNYFHVADRDEVRCMATQWGIQLNGCRPPAQCLLRRSFANCVCVEVCVVHSAGKE